MNCYLGIDVGTSGCRAIIIDDTQQVVSQAAVDMPAQRRAGNAISQHPDIWWQALQQCLKQLSANSSLSDIKAIAIDATSASVLLSDAQGNVLGGALMYNDTRATDQAAIIDPLIPADAACHGPQASIAKALWLLKNTTSAPAYILHQTDWLTARLTGDYAHTDINNILKLGYDVVNQCWPEWLQKLDRQADSLLKKLQIHTPGKVIGTVTKRVAQEFGLQADTQVCAGTTDSTAAFIASGAEKFADAVTSLGSTLVIKIISDKPIFNASHGVYSHRLYEKWLTGGASNSGGAILKKFFSAAQIKQLSTLINPLSDINLDYYPLCDAGERFPVNDPSYSPRISPRPADDSEFLHGLLQGIARIEQQGYQLLQQLGAPYPKTLRSVGKGASNPTWTTLRRRLLNTTFTDASHTEAAYGSALLAKRGYNGVQI